MTDKDRKVYIRDIALAIMNIVGQPIVDREKIYYFADAAFNLAASPDSRIQNNKEQFDSILTEAKAINNKR